MKKENPFVNGLKIGLAGDLSKNKASDLLVDKSQPGNKLRAAAEDLGIGVGLILNVRSHYRFFTSGYKEVAADREKDKLSKE